MKKLIHLIIPFFLFACEQAPQSETTIPTVDRYAHIQDTTARKIIKRAIEHAGGIAQWEALKALSYTKDFDLLLESGDVEKAFQQVHNYKFHPEVIQINSLENEVEIKTTFENGKYQRFMDGKPIDVDQESLQKAVNTSTYVISMPFKLLDEGVALEYLGEEKLFNKTPVDIVQASYNADQHAHHSTSDVWRYYFDKEDGKIIANWVQTGDHFSLIENLTFTRAGGILFNKDRASYRVDSLGNKLYLRAKYLYDNYKVEK